MPRFLPIRTGAAALSLSVACAAAAAQQPLQTYASPSPTPVRYSVASGGEPDPIADDSGVAVFRLRQPRGTVLLLVAMPGARSLFGDRAALARTLGPCASAALPDTLPWTAFDSVASDRDLIVLHATTRASGFAGCAGAEAPSTIANGIEWVSAERGWAFPPALLDAIVTRGTTRLRPVFFGRRPTAIAGGKIDSASLAIGPHDLRIYVHARDVFLAQGPTQDLHVWLLTRDGGWTPTVVLPHAWIDSVWRAALPVRLARMAERPRLTTTLPALVPPTDTALRAAHLAYRLSDDLGSARAAATTLAARGGSLTPEDARFAHLVVGSVLLSRGDTLGGRAEYAAALRSAPCLQLATGTAGAFATALDDARPDIRCDPIAATTLIERGMLFPGGAQARRGQAGGAGAVLGITVVALTTAYFEHVHANQLDRTYLATTDYTRLVYLRHSANAANRTAVAALTTGASVWLGSAVWGVFRERIWAGRTGFERSYGARAEGAAR